MAYKRNSPQPVVEGATGIQSATAYSPLSGGTVTTNPLTSLSSGQASVGSVLTSNGSSAFPTWQPQTSGGSIELLSTKTVSGSAFTWAAPFISSTYTCYLIVLDNIQYSGTVTRGVALRLFNTGGGVARALSAGCTYWEYNSATHTTLNNSPANAEGYLSVFTNVDRGQVILYFNLNTTSPGFNIASWTSTFSAWNGATGGRFGVAGGIGFSNNFVGGSGPINSIELSIFPVGSFVNVTSSIYGIKQ